MKTLKTTKALKTISICLILAICACIGFNSCTSNSRARNWGGKTTINLPKGEKLIEATWKGESSIWYLTEPMDSDYIPKNKVLKESSPYGIVEGTVVFIETK